MWEQHDFMWALLTELIYLWISAACCRWLALQGGLDSMISSGPFLSLQFCDLWLVLCVPYMPVWPISLLAGPAAQYWQAPICGNRTEGTPRTLIPQHWGPEEEVEHSGCQSSVFSVCSSSYHFLLRYFKKCLIIRCKKCHRKMSSWFSRAKQNKLLCSFAQLNNLCYVNSKDKIQLSTRITISKCMSLELQ